MSRQTPVASREPSHGACESLSGLRIGQGLQNIYGWVWLEVLGPPSAGLRSRSSSATAEGSSEPSGGAPYRLSVSVSPADGLFVASGVSSVMSQVYPVGTDPCTRPQTVVMMGGSRSPGSSTDHAIGPVKRQGRRVRRRLLINLACPGYVEDAGVFAW